MRKLPLYLFTFLLLFSGCANMTELHKKANMWMSDNAGNPEINVAGQWNAVDWGYCRLKQKGNRISGLLGDYVVRGSINGKTIYMSLYYGKDLYYTARLEEQEKGFLMGHFYAYMKHGDGGRQILLRSTK